MHANININMNINELYVIDDWDNTNREVEQPETTTDEEEQELLIQLQAHPATTDGCTSLKKYNKKTWTQC